MAIRVLLATALVTISSMFNYYSLSIFATNFSQISFALALSLLLLLSAWLTSQLFGKNNRALVIFSLTTVILVVFPFFAWGEQAGSRQSFSPISIDSTVSVANKDYLLKYSPTAEFADRFAANSPMIIVLAGLFTTILALIFFSFARQKNRQRYEFQEFCRASFEGATNGMALVTIDGHFVRVNKALCNLLGYSESELLTRTVNDVTYLEDMDASIAFMQQLLANGREHFRLEKRYLRNDGKVVWALLSASVMYNSDGAAGYFVVQIQDITLQKTYEIGLQQATLAAEEATRTKGEFLAQVSHEIRTPLTAIIGFTEQLLDKTINDTERNDLTQVVLRNAHHLLNIVNDTLDYSKMEAGKLSVDAEKSSLFELLNFIESIFARHARDNGLAFKVNVDFPVPRDIFTDALRLRQILLNLIGNALKFTEHGSVQLRVTYDQGRGFLAFAVTDTGVGLTEAQLATLFQTFTQADSTTAKRFGGTGLGLAISKRLAQMLGGDIKVESRFRVGSTFNLDIPVGRVEDEDLIYNRETSILKEVVSDDTSSTQLSGRVLVVEDGYDNQRLICRLLNKVGVQAAVAGNGRQALSKAFSESYEIILMDMQMPVMDGYAATKLLRARGFVGPIVGCSADASRENHARIIEAGCTDVLFKPFTSSELCTLFKKYLPTSLRQEQKYEDKDTGLNESERSELRKGFVGRLGSRIAVFKDAEKQNNFKEIAEAAHKLAGATMFGFSELGKLASELEKTARNQDEARSRDLLHEIYGICQNLKADGGRSQ